MTLLEIVKNLETLDSENTIYAAKPWTEDSIAMVIPEPESGKVPDEAKKLGLSYFMEVSIAQDLIEDWIKTLSSPTTFQQKCKRLLQYAVDDA